MEITVTGLVANYAGLTNQQLLDYLKKRTNGFEYHQFRPIPGKVYAAVINWKAVGNVSSVLGIVSFIWMAYLELIAPNKDPNSNSGIIIQIQNVESNNNQVNLWIGNDIKSEEELLKRVKAAFPNSRLDTVNTRSKNNKFRE